MSTYYFTFGSGHHDTKGRSLLGWYTSIDAENHRAARDIFFDRFGGKFATSYSDPGFQEQIKEYGLQYEPFEFLDLCCQVRQDEYLEVSKNHTFERALLSDEVRNSILKLRTFHASPGIDDTSIVIRALEVHTQLAAYGISSAEDINRIGRAFAQGKIK